ncbi:MAG TPA: hypothetical protein VH878_04070, partial [Thermodesulfobacteriota bacterium]
MVIFSPVTEEIIKGNSVPFRGNLIPPGDKSISHRAVILGSLTQGVTVIDGFLSCD